MFIKDENKFNNIKNIQYAWKHRSNVARHLTCDRSVVFSGSSGFFYQ